MGQIFNCKLTSLYSRFFFMIIIYIPLGCEVCQNYIWIRDTCRLYWYVLHYALWWIKNNIVYCMHVGYQRFEFSQCFGLSAKRDMLYYVRSTFLVSWIKPIHWIMKCKLSRTVGLSYMSNFIYCSQMENTFKQEYLLKTRTILHYLVSQE